MKKKTFFAALLVILLVVFASCVEQLPNPEVASNKKFGLSSDVTVYTNASLNSPWSNWSWSTNNAFANADAPLTASSSTQIKTTLTGAWGALSIARSTGDIPITDFNAVTFDVRGTSSQTIYLSLENYAGASGTQLAVAVTTGWVKKTIPITSIKGSSTTFARLHFQGSAVGQTFYVDNVKLLANAPPPSPTFPTNPLTVTKNTVVNLTGASGPYSLFVPNAYDASHNTQSKLLLWFHGCGGSANGDAWLVSPGGTQSWLTVSVGGRDGVCWDVNSDTTLALGALTDIKTRLNIDPKRVVIGGYSSGGDMAYRTAFYNAAKFSGLIAENTSPFRDTGSTQAQSIAAATWKFNVAHLAHLSDANYLIATVRVETDALTAATFPLVRIERAGTHYDPDTANSGTAYDLRTYLLPSMDVGWVAP